MRCSCLLAVIAVVTIFSTGCSTLRLPPLVPALGIMGASGDDTYSDEGVGMQLQGSESAQAFKRVAQAKSQNAIVLHVPGDAEPMRVLPLPGDGQSVFVSDLLRQSGVQQKIGRVQAVLYRSSPQSINGIRMAVNMAPDGKTVRPESDYALRAGDRLEVAEAPPRPLNGMFTTILGL